MVEPSADQVRNTYALSGGQCEYVADDGRRCTSRAFGQVDHVRPRALGGNHDQLRHLCGPHNRYLAEVALGKERVEEARKREEVTRDIGTALRNTGFSPRTARELSSRAVLRLGTDAPLEALLREALRQAGSPTGAREVRAMYGPYSLSSVS